MVGVKDLNVCTKLGFTPGIMVFVCFEGLRFLAKQVELGKTGLVICKHNAITMSALCRDRSRSPDITVNFTTKLGCTIALMSLQDGLTGGLSIYARLAEEVLVQSFLKTNACDKTILHKTLGKNEGNVTHTMVELLECPSNFGNLANLCSFRTVNNSLTTTKHDYVAQVVKTAYRHKCVPDIQ
ncbi:hypothetical protein H0H87_004872 [Tephrocybe sp. NHM501043]|nr:hypothetical protein H0H87_004872 [Tephrocybe sp. NHM501043]